jgi:A/G-specific adenine glycosylase
MSMDALAHITPSAKIKTQWHKKLLAWFQTEQRQLPWRGTQDLYAIWVSEIMLQQTQVITVIDYFQRFLVRFPSVTSLAQADISEVLRYWEGLGYYRRARQLHAAAQHIVAQHAGQFPESYAQVLALPGIGRYTAGAILSIGRDQCLPILEANTIRVMSRLHAYADSTTTSAGQQQLWQFAADLLPKQETGAWNQALMELGATVCTPREPKCLACPLQRDCPTRRGGWQEKIPAPKTAIQYEAIHDCALVLQNRSLAILLRRHTNDEHWTGLWDVPRFTIPMTHCELSDKYLAQQFTQQTGQPLDKQKWEAIMKFQHAVTKYRIQLQVYRTCVKTIDSGKLPATAEFAVVPVEQLAHFPMTAPCRKIVKHLVENEPL